jgi:hypothetical protein
VPVTVPELKKLVVPVIFPVLAGVTLPFASTVTVKSV